jgi:hypothetical protein
MYVTCQYVLRIKAMDVFHLHTEILLRIIEFVDVATIHALLRIDISEVNMVQTKAYSHIEFPLDGANYPEEFTTTAEHKNNYIALHTYLDYPIGSFSLLGFGLLLHPLSFLERT